MAALSHVVGIGSFRTRTRTRTHTRIVSHLLTPGEAGQQVLTLFRSPGPTTYPGPENRHSGFFATSDRYRSEHRNNAKNTGIQMGARQRRVSVRCCPPPKASEDGFRSFRGLVLHFEKRSCFTAKNRNDVGTGLRERNRYPPFLMVVHEICIRPGQTGFKEFFSSI